MTEISIIKTSSGEDVVGSVTYHPNFLLVEDALVFVQRASMGEMGIQLVRYMPYAEESSVKLDRTAVVCVSKASDAIVEFYKISVVYNGMFTKKIDASIMDAATYMKAMLNVGTSEESKDDFFQKMGSDILNNFSSNTKN
jgi:hypothetical protein